MSLRHDLDAMREEFAKRAPPGRVALYESKIRELEAEFKQRRLLRAGDAAPDFALPNAMGREVTLNANLTRGAAVIVFYRGGWCPYCNVALSAFQRVLPEIERLGAHLIAISPQAPDRTLSTAEKNVLTFEVLSDVGNRVARAYSLCYSLPQELREVLLANGKSLPDINGVDAWELPVPATFVIGTDGRIALAEVHIDYRQRLEPEAVIGALAQLRAATVASA